MATVEIELENSAYSPKVESDWWEKRAYRCHIALISEDDGSFSAVVLNLPGCGSCGPSEEEAIKNVREAISGVIESHNAAGEEIPWTDTANDYIPVDSKRIWILVDAQ
jgi:predicted RNase H-like HicB family nuclease